MGHSLRELVTLNQRSEILVTEASGHQGALEPVEAERLEGVAAASDAAAVGGEEDGDDVDEW